VLRSVWKDRIIPRSSLDSMAIQIEISGQILGTS